jgi:hypothetical protein
MIGGMPEGKGLGELEMPLLLLLDALAGKGFDVATSVMGPADEEDDPDEDATDEEDPELVSDADVLDGAEPMDDEDVDGELDEESDPYTDDEEDDEVDPSSETVTLDPETVKKQMEELRA